MSYLPINYSMKSARFEETGTPEDVLSIQEVPIPSPAQGEVRIKVMACNINPSDIMFVMGLYGIQAKLPATGGFEGAGEIESVGPGVDLPVGMRVIFSAIGVWQEYVVVPAKSLIPTPKGLSDEVACQAFVNPFTAYGMLQEAQLKPGQWLLLTAGASSFSKFAIQLCKKRDINVICTLRRDQGIEELKELGAKEVINTSTENLEERVKSITDGKGVDIVFDAVGGDLGAEVLQTLKSGGIMYVYGLLSLQNIPINSGLMIFKNLSIKGFWLTGWLAQLHSHERREVIQRVLSLLATKELKADVEALYPLTQIKKAVAHAQAPGRKGKIILINRRDD